MAVLGIFYLNRFRYERGEQVSGPIGLLSSKQTHDQVSSRAKEANNCGVLSKRDKNEQLDLTC